MKRTLWAAMAVVMLMAIAWLLRGADGHVGLASRSPALSAFGPSVPLPCSTPTFGPPINYGSGQNAYDVVVADFNHDGNPDLAVPNYYAGTISVLLGDGSGGFGAFTSYPSGPQPWTLAVGDFNRDGNLDLVAGNWNTNYVSVLLGDGMGRFGPASTFPAGSYPGQIAVADFNHDNNPDLVVVIYAGGVSVLLGDGTGRFDNRTFYFMGASPQRLTVADFNRDGNSDVAVAPTGSNAVSVRLGDGTGGLGPVAYFPLSDVTYAVAAGDFNHDGYPDLAVTVAHVNFSLLAVLIGDGTGSFGAPTYYTLEPAAALSLTVKDFNLDGDLDLALVGQGPNEANVVSVWLGDGQGGFDGVRYFYVGTSLRAVATGDFNLDGRPDLVTANDQSNTVSVLLSTCGVSTPTAMPNTTDTPTSTPTDTPTDTPTSPPTFTPTTPLISTPTHIATATYTPTPTPTSTATSTACPIRFTDVDQNNTFYTYIRCLACQGVISGYSTGCETGNPCFRPNNNVTRGQISKIVSNSAGFSEPHTEQTFQDVPLTHTFYIYLERLAFREIIAGYSCGGASEPCISPENRPYFRPANNATRGQLSKIVCRARGCSGIPTGRSFEDVPPSHTFYTYIEQLHALGAISGYPCGGASEPCIPPENRPYFRPAGNATRGQTTRVLATVFFPNCQMSKQNESGRE